MKDIIFIVAMCSFSFLIVLSCIDTVCSMGLFRPPVSTECPGDLNKDGIIDHNDTNLFLQDYGRNKYHRPCIDSDPCNGDFDSDGDVDADDIDIMLRELDRGTCP